MIRASRIEEAKMGQKSWGFVCALSALMAGASGLTAQEHPAGKPFGDGKEAASQKEAKAESKSATAGSSQAEAQRRIEGVLRQRLHSPLSFMQQPLSQVASVLSEEYDIPIQFDTAALDAVAVTPDVEVTINIANVSLKAALLLILRNAGAEELTYVIDHEVLLITTQEEAEKHLEVRVYRVDDLVRKCGSPDLYRDPDFDSLINAITASVRHDSWMVNGTGEGEIQPLQQGILVISNTHPVHEQIEQLLDQLKETTAAMKANSQQADNPAENRAVTKIIRFSDRELTDADNRPLLTEALKKSVDWKATGDLKPEDVFVQVLPGAVLVHHLPNVIDQVEDVLHELRPSKDAPPVMGGRAAASGGRGGSAPRGGGTMGEQGAGVF
jgi:hypothetical protein